VVDDAGDMTAENVTTSDNALFTPPAVPWAADALDLVFSQESRSVANHSLRSWAFARLLADHLNLAAEVDETLLFAGTVLHDIGLRRDARAPVRFEIDGADYAAEFLTARGLPATDVDKVWEAIAFHTTPGIPERRGPLTLLVRFGAGVDFGHSTEFLTDEHAAAIHEEYPRLSFPSSIVDDIVEQVREVPERGPMFSIGAEFTRERATPPHLAQVERDCEASRWADF
jgi:HD domain